MAYRDELEAALARAEAAERLLASVCYVHSNETGTSICGRCKRRICDACTIDTLEGTRCGLCIMSQPSRRFAPWLAGSGAAVLVVAALAGMMAIGGRPYHRRHETPTAVATARQTTFFAEQAREALEREPCSRAAAITYARELNRLGNFMGNLTFTRDFEARCGSYGYLRWTSVFAHEQRGEWRQAAGVASSLIADDPSDADFWWWRGNDLLHTGEVRQAAVDFAQSLARRPSSEIALRYADAAQRLGRHCEGAFALQATIAAGEDDPAARERRRNLYLAADCAALEGTGAATVIWPGHGAVPRTVRGSVNGKVITLLVTPEAALTTITSAVAERAGLARQEGTVEIWASGSLRDAELAVADEMSVEGTQAKGAMPVAIVPELPAGIDGLVGMSYLQRFSISHQAEGLKLSPLPR